MVRIKTEDVFPGLNLQSGPIFSFDLIPILEDVDALSIGYHVVIDLVPWRIILADRRAFSRPKITYTGASFICEIGLVLSDRDSNI